MKQAYAKVVKLHDREMVVIGVCDRYEEKPLLVIADTIGSNKVIDVEEAKKKFRLIQETYGKDRV
jgi:hypothetical protein